MKEAILKGPAIDFDAQHTGFSLEPHIHDDLRRQRARHYPNHYCWSLTNINITPRLAMQ
eukprot:COSAG02_NODE_536_length_20657_cov_91.744041_7_plen_59_part_00